MKQPATLLFTAPAGDGSSPPRPQGAPPRDQAGPAGQSPPCLAPAPPMAFTVGAWDEKAFRMVYLARAASAGNLMSTTDALFAKTWQSPELVRMWVADLPDGVRAQLDAKPRMILPVAATVGEAVGMLEAAKAPEPAA